MPDISPTLARLGLKSSDAAVFMLLLRNRAGLYAQDIARQGNIQRSSVDVILTRLLEAGYVVQTRPGARTLYQAQDPEKILYARASVLDEFRNLIPFMRSLDATPEASDLRFFTGREGLERFYDDALHYLAQQAPGRREVLSISSGTAVMKLIPDLEQFWVRRRVALGVPVRVIAPLTSQRVRSYHTDESKLRQLRYFDAKKYPFHAVFEVFGPELVTLYAAKEPLQGVMIRHASLASSLRSFFNLVWDSLPIASKD